MVIFGPPGSHMVDRTCCFLQAHPSFMERTVQQLQADPSLFMATGACLFMRHSSAVSHSAVAVDTPSPSDAS